MDSPLLPSAESAGLITLRASPINRARVAATRAPVEFTGVSITRIKDGKIIEAWNNFDFMKMYKQLGVI
jgi:hypothetical protein